MNVFMNASKIIFKLLVQYATIVWMKEDQSEHTAPHRCTLSVVLYTDHRRILDTMNKENHFKCTRLEANNYVEQHQLYRMSIMLPHIVILYQTVLDNIM